MFDLEKEIARWRQQMLTAGIKTPVPLDELEIHLREEIERQIKSGLDEHVAFNSAVQKIGLAQAVQIEFKKVEAIKMTGERKLTEIILGTFAILIPLAMGWLVLFKFGSLSDITSAQQMSGLIAIAAFALLIWGGRLGYGMFPAIRAKRIRDAIAFSCLVPVALWWIVFLRIIVPRHDFTMVEFTVAFLWAFFTPAGLGLGVVWGIETAARKKVSTADS